MNSILTVVDGQVFCVTFYRLYAAWWLSRSVIIAVDEWNHPAITEALPFPVKSRRSSHQSDVAACYSRRQRTDGGTAALHNEFDAESVAVSCINHVDQLIAGRMPVERTSLLSAGRGHSENTQSTAAFGNCSFFPEIGLQRAAKSWPVASVRQKVPLYQIVTRFSKFLHACIQK